MGVAEREESFFFLNFERTLAIKNTLLLRPFLVHLSISAFTPYLMVVGEARRKKVERAV